MLRPVCPYALDQLVVLDDDTLQHALHTSQFALQVRNLHNWHNETQVGGAASHLYQLQHDSPRSEQQMIAEL